MGSRKNRKTSRRTAHNSDPYELYELSVQEPTAECEVVEQVWREIRGRLPRSLREDFCGTAITAVEWVRRDRRNRAVCVDLDDKVIERARQRIAKRLRPVQRKRIELVVGDVLKIEPEPVDCVLATNFSYFTFKTRRKLKRYLRRAHEALVDDGLLILDSYGGSDSHLEMKEDREVDGFTYVWDQHHYNPVSGDVINYIHFRFPDGSRIRRAFTYEWRLWTLPELRELLKEAGFKDVTIYWEGTDEESEEGNGVWTVSKVGEACQGWVAYLVAEK
jgi:SAM-dependent methyltransferase